MSSVPLTLETVNGYAPKLYEYGTPRPWPKNQCAECKYQFYGNDDEVVWTDDLHEPGVYRHTACIVPAIAPLPERIALFRQAQTIEQDLLFQSRERRRLANEVEKFRTALGKVVDPERVPFNPSGLEVNFDGITLRWTPYTGKSELRIVWTYNCCGTEHTSNQIRNFEDLAWAVQEHESYEHLCPMPEDMKERFEPAAQQEQQRVTAPEAAWDHLAEAIQLLLDSGKLSIPGDIIR